MEAFKYTFSKPGALTAALNYHRNAFKSTGRTLPRSSDKVEKPILMIWVRILFFNHDLRLYAFYIAPCLVIKK